MKIKFENGEMRVTHPSGHVDHYRQSDIETQKTMIQDQIAEVQTAQNILDDHIIAIQNSLGA